MPSDEPIYSAIAFFLPEDSKTAKRALARLREVFELINMDKEEQALDADFFKGNLADYPDWLRESFSNAAFVEEFTEFLEAEPNELDTWDLDAWYEDLFLCQAWDFKIDSAAQPGRRTLAFRIEGEAYGGDTAHAWVLVAAGATSLDKVQD